MTACSLPNPPPSVTGIFWDLACNHQESTCCLGLCWIILRKMYRSSDLVLFSPILRFPQESTPAWCSSSSWAVNATAGTLYGINLLLMAELCATGREPEYHWMLPFVPMYETQEQTVQFFCALPIQNGSMTDTMIQCNPKHTDNTVAFPTVIHRPWSTSYSDLFQKSSST